MLISDLLNQLVCPDYLASLISLAQLDAAILLGAFI